MHHETVFKITFGVLVVLLLGAIGHAHRQAMRTHGSRFAQAANEYPPLLWVRGLLGIPLWVFLIDWLASAGWFPWASVALPVWARWSGAGFGLVVVGFMWWTIIALGSNYRGTMGLHPNHTLVTHGPYRFVRHPMNAVFPLMSIVLFLQSANWVVGAGVLILLGTISIVRTPIEERQLIERFGEEYRAYMRQTGRFLPRLRGAATGEPGAGAPAAGRIAARAGLRMLLLLGVGGGLLFWAAGTIAWIRAWALLGLWVATFVFNIVILLRTNPGLVLARMNRQQPGAKFEKVMVPLILAATPALPIVAGADAVRYAWTCLPRWTMWAGVMAHVAGVALMLWAMSVNPFLEGGVRIQRERGHRVISTGPYAVVRHPMYVGLILLLAGIPLFLGSGWALLPAGLAALLLVIRMVMEDRMLRRELPGYEAYTHKTPHRLIPGIW